MDQQKSQTQRGGLGPDLIAVAVSAGLLLYLFFVAVPYADRIGLLSEGGMPTVSLVPYFMMTVPVMLVYLVYLVRRLFKTSRLRVALYPLAVANLYFGVFFCALLVYGGTILWLMIPTLLLPAVLIPVTCIAGFILDRRAKNKRLQQEQEELQAHRVP